MVHKDGDGSCLAQTVAAGDKLFLASCLFMQHGDTDQ